MGKYSLSKNVDPYMIRKVSELGSFDFEALRPVSPEGSSSAGPSRSDP